MCQKMNSHDPVWIPAPRRPFGVNDPEKVSACGITISAVNIYPLASASNDLEREMENCAKSRTAVTKSVIKTMASSDGKSALSRARGKPAKGNTTRNPSSAKPATLMAPQVCRLEGNWSEIHTVASVGNSPMRGF
jgi:hypothetical protein